VPRLPLETNLSRDALLILLEHLWNEATNASRVGGDGLVRALDDIGELLRDAPAAGAEAEEFDFSRCVAETVELSNLAFASRGGRLVLEVPGRLAVRQDRHLVEQVLTRILSAELKLAPDEIVRVAVGACGRDRVLVSITASDSDLAVRLAKWLNADLGQLEFAPSDRTGWIVPLLAAGRQLRALGGAAELVSEPGAPGGLGLFLPRHSDHYQGRTDALRILLAEHCDQNFALATLLLEDEIVHRVRTGLEAIALMKQRRVDVVLMDTQMPCLDGYRVIREIREWETRTSRARTPIVVLSSGYPATEAREAARSGCSGFLRKPVERAQLIELLESLRAFRARVA
jgi:CheY-like chemotaxis protein